MRSSHRRVVVALLALALVQIGPASRTDGSPSVSSPPPYRDATLSVEERVADLLGRMTLEEKVAQTVAVWSQKNRFLDTDGRFDLVAARRAFPHGVGQVARPSDNWQRGTPGVTPTRSPRETVDLVNAIQRWLVEETRLGIPAILHEEGLHGYQARDATSFPQAIALASTWDPHLVEEVYRIVGREIRARGAVQALTPVVDVARDPRWGRIEETFGEDPHLVAEMGLAAVRGFQGASLPLAADRVFATLKHMTGHGQPESGTNVGPANLSERLLREVFFPPFERAVREAGAMSVMASYNEIDGIPSHVNRWLLTDVLRGEWGFEGFVVADYYAVAELVRRHGVAPTPAEAAAQALRAGVDIELPDPEAYPHLSDLIASGRLPEAVLDRAVARLLRAKFLAGLFESPYADADYAERITGNAEARRVAVRAAERAVVLLENDAGLLPLDPAALRRVAVIGPNAAETILGGYSDVPKQTVSLLDGVRQRVGDQVDVVFARGVRITESRNWWADEVRLADPEENRRLIAEAVEVAGSADVVVLAVGDNEQTSREAWAETHLGDRTRLDLVGQQDDLVRAVIATGTPTVVVLIHGRPLAVSWIAEAAGAVVDAWYLGQETGTALARVLFGDVNPGGKLPVTVPRSVGQLPVFYNHKPTARRGYLFDTTAPLWPFGHGLSYTEFEIGAPRLSRPRIAPGESVAVEIDVTNVGDRSGDEVVQLYLQDPIASVTRPVKELAGFERITLAPGERRTVAFEIGPPALRFFDRQMRRVIEPGEFEVMVGPSSVDLRSVTLIVEEEAGSGPGAER
ncbi:MAG: glycoside hydrolase family 3 N-terminal domain-containing protein [Thermoanaerobaculia bacterium]|nr:glycoside hydrolase family 3 N-terminal domain-containing protein [Thermoanaerobaculia bacterium]